MKKNYPGSVEEAIEQAQELLNQAKEAGGKQAEQLQEKAQEILHQAKQSFGCYYQQASEQGRQIAHNVNDCVHENPWRAVGVAALVGVIIGALLARK